MNDNSDEPKFAIWREREKNLNWFEIVLSEREKQESRASKFEFQSGALE